MFKINLRAWDKKNKRMFYAGSLSAVANYYMAKYEEKSCTDEEFYNRFSDIDYKWMLSTNHKDKNRKRDIFDGDIVRSDVPLRDVFFPEYIGYISIDFINSGKINVRNKDGLVSDKDFIEIVDSLEVIGNIYKNPELLDNIN